MVFLHDETSVVRVSIFERVSAMQRRDGVESFVRMGWFAFDGGRGGKRQVICGAAKIGCTGSGTGRREIRIRDMPKMMSTH